VTLTLTLNLSLSLSLIKLYTFLSRGVLIVRHRQVHIINKIELEELWLGLYCVVAVPGVQCGCG